MYRCLRDFFLIVIGCIIISVHYDLWLGVGLNFIAIGLWDIEH